MKRCIYAQYLLFNMVLQYSPGIYIQYSIINHNGNEIKLKVDKGLLSA